MILTISFEAKLWKVDKVEVVEEVEEVEEAYFSLNLKYVLSLKSTLRVFLFYPQTYRFHEYP